MSAIEASTIAWASAESCSGSMAAVMIDVTSAESRIVNSDIAESINPWAAESVIPAASTSVNEELTIA